MPVAFSGALDVTTGSVAGLSIATGSGAKHHPCPGAGRQPGADADRQRCRDRHAQRPAILRPPPSTACDRHGDRRRFEHNTGPRPGNNGTSITGSDAADAIAVVATALDDNKTLTLAGWPIFTVTGPDWRSQATTLDGDLDIHPPPRSRGFRSRQRQRRQHHPTAQGAVYPDNLRC